MTFKPKKLNTPCMWQLAGSQPLQPSYESSGESVLPPVTLENPETSTTLLDLLLTNILLTNKPLLQAGGGGGRIRTF